MSTTSSTENSFCRADWHKSAPESIRNAFSAGDGTAGWSAWKDHLASRRKPVDPDRLIRGVEEPMNWGVPEGLDMAPIPDWLGRALDGNGRRIDPALQKELLGWLAETSGAAADVGNVLEDLACCRALPKLAAVLSSDAWFALVDHLLAVVVDASAIDKDRDPLPHQLAAGELALTLAYLFPEIKACRKLKSAARQALTGGLEDLLDGEGLPHASYVPSLRPLLACWTRCRALGEQLKGGCWNDAAEDQYEWLVRHTLRLTRHDGTHVFSSGSPDKPDTALLKTALRFGGDDDDHDIASYVLPGGKRRASKSSDAELPDAASHSEWAAVAVLRPDWSRTGPRLSVLYPDRSVRLELGCGKDIVLSGRWELDVSVDGKQLAAESDWEEVCWLSDEDVDYLEIEIELADGVRVQRQMLLARKDRFLLLADAVLGKRTGKIEYQGRLPLGTGTEFQGADESREGFLVGSKRRAHVLPIALPEWRGDNRTGQLAQSDGTLQLQQSAEARRLYAPLFFDLDPRRMTRRMTWRQLSVAESLQTVAHDVAVGYRVAIGKRQWLIYRSLAEKANRTLLGHNLSTETVVGQFDRSGEVEPLIEIE